jgi:hypothetical protein
MLFLLLVGIGGLSMGQNRGAVPQAPPLTAELVDSMANYTQWVLSIEFSPSQRQIFSRIMQQYWANNNREEIAGSLIAGSIYQLLPALSDVQRYQLQQELKNRMLSNLYANSDRPDHRWLLQVYHTYHPQTVPPSQNSGSLADDLGNWAGRNQMFNNMMNNTMIFPSLR